MHRGSGAAPRAARDVERPAAGEHLVQADAERKDVGARVDRRRRHPLLRRDVGLELAPPRRCRAVALRAHQRRGRGDAKVADRERAVGVKEQILRPQPGVPHALLVGALQAMADLHRQVQADAQVGGATARDPRPQGAASAVLDDQKRQAVETIDVMAVDDVGVQTECRPAPRIGKARLRGAGPDASLRGSGTTSMFQGDGAM
jgi:hypothetical protein